MPANMIQPLNIELGNHSYPIYVGENAHACLSELRQHLEGRAAFVITNPTVAPLYLPNLLKHLTPLVRQVEVIEVPDGEQYKTVETLAHICGELLKLQADRRSILVALGGGVVGDITGFAASIYQRGISFIQVPTTLLAQVDSSIGGKTAINHPLGKNMIGAFHQPIAVFSNTQCFNTLPNREFAAGMAEVIKHGLILDSGYYEWIKTNRAPIQQRDAEVLRQMVVRSCEIKASVVKQDERETKGLRALLNLGHTFGHAIESATQYKAYLHGEAVAIGTVIAAHYSCEHHGLLSAFAKDIEHTFASFGLPTHLESSSKHITAKVLVSYMLNDKKNDSNLINLIVLPQLGKANFQKGVSAQQVERFLEAYLTEANQA
jgi:3-dehydroquinate synthase